MDIKNVNGTANNSTSSVSKNNIKSTNETTSNISSNTSADPLKNTISQLKNDGLKTRDVTVDDIDAIGEKAGKEILKSYGVPEQVLNKVDTKNFDKISPAKKINDAGNKKIKEQLAKRINKNPQLKKAVNGLSNAVGRPINTSSESQETNQDFDNNQNLDVNTNSNSTDILGKIGNFIKNNPGVVVTAMITFLVILIPILFVLLIATGVMYVVEQLSNITSFIEDAGQIIWNGITLNGWRTDQNVYLFNIEEISKSFLNKADKTDVDEDKIRYYVNTTTFYSNFVNPELLEEVGKDEGNNSSDKKPEDNSSEEEITNEFANSIIGDSDELRKKYGDVKNDPKSLIPNMFECGVYENNLLVENKKCSGLIPSNENEKWYFSEGKYKKYLLETYVPQKFINCDNCGFKNSTEQEKDNAKRRMTEEILSQAKTFYKQHNINDQSNYTAYNISVSGITVKDLEGNVIGLFSLTEYVETIVERDAASYNDEIKKAYALNIISKLLSRIANGEIVEENFNREIVTESTKKAVEKVKDLKIMKDGKVYYSTFDFEKAQTVEPQEYESILKALFGDDITIEKSISNGLQLDPITGFYMRVEAPDKNDINYYGSNNHGLIGECAWYATNRAREVTRILGVTEFNDNGHGGNFCYFGDAKKFKTCWPSKGEKCPPKQGAIISWKYSWGPYVDYGHVAIIEQVNGNEVLYSDSATSRGSKGLSADTIPHSQRYDNCTENPKKSCIMTNRKATVNELETGGSWGRYIVCYIYLDEPLEVEQ